MKTMSAVAVILLLATSVGRAAEDLMKGKIRTGRSISLETVVSGTPDVVYRLWLSEGSVQSFFAPKSHIDARVGGEYNMIFWPEKYPQGENFGTKGARILRLDPGRAIWFEWKCFVLEDKEARSSPPPVSLEEYVERPLPTWVEVAFEPVKEGKTRVRLSHQGFQTGGKWDEAFVYFSRAWATVITRLSSVAQKRESPPNDFGTNP